MKPVFLYGLLATLFFCFGSCKNTDDEFLPDDVLPPVPEGYVRMRITVPGLTPVSTYALSSDDESKVSTVGVLVFKDGLNANDDTYLCYTAVTEPLKIFGAGSTKTFDVDLRAAGNITSAYVMVVANASVDTTGFAASPPTKETVMQSMTFASSGKWPVDGSKTFPMWGMTDSPVLLAGITISLLRSVARIDVGLKFPDNVTDGAETAAGLESTFTLEEVYLYNSLNKGSIAPYSGKYSGTTVTAPSIPTSSPTPGVNPAIPYLATDPDDGFSSNKSCMNAIYMAEHAEGNRNALSTNPYLVIGGRYGSLANPITYYRLDFVSGSYPGQTFLPVLRNHRYLFNITEVKGPGYTTVDLAAEARPVNLTYDLSATDESLASYDYNGQYALGVSQDSYTLDNAARTGITLKVSTTYEKGYKAESDQGWLTIAADGKETATANSSGSSTTLTFSVDANGGGQRSGTITITSGRLTKVITVTQKSTADGFSVTSPSGDYSGEGVTDASLSVTSSWSWNVNVKSDPNAIVTSFTPNGTGNGTFYFSLKANSSYTLVPSAVFTFFSPTGEFTASDITVNQAKGEFHPSMHKGWAGSNIYWNGSTLTFDEETTNRNYQGVFFKWGSLVGIDPSGSSSSNMAWSTSKTVYIPNAATGAWTSSYAGTGNTYNTWDNIPYADNTVVGNIGDETRASLYEVHDPANLVGDICRYLTDTGRAPGSPGTKWRMPTSEEFGENTDYIKSGTFITSGSYTVYQSDATGRYSNSDAPGYTKNNNPWFPAAGYRYYDYGTLYVVGYGGGYWSSSPYDSSDAYCLDFTSNSVFPASDDDRRYGFSVRCVKE
ncbi:MAG: hypothetical protein LBR26_05145 [Prevotella sp.]|jgi:uncharacterized protein (TIGR02145 family)|nr:hypothetical protein [Prevotella sp.]